METKSIKSVVIEENENEVVDLLHKPIRKLISTIKTTGGSSQQENVFITVVIKKGYRELVKE